jgi:LCP family protein required for cell wall assembly
MFERFDDPAGFRPGPALRDGVRRRGEVLRRRRRRLVAGTSAAFVAVAAIGAGALYVDRRDEAIDREDLSTQPVPADGAVNVLLVGTDGPVAEGARADSIAVLRLDDAGSHLLSIPRDLLSDVSGTRINQATVDGGAQGLVDAVEATTGIPVNHFVAIEPEGFVDLVDAVGGLEVSINGTFRDQRLGLVLDAADCTTLDGTQALGLARSRHLEQQADGGWGIDVSGDLGRMARQRAMLGAALDQLGTDPATIDRLSRLLADHAVVDDGLDLAGLVSLGRRLAGGPALVTEGLPVDSSELPGGASVLVPGDGFDDVVAAYGGPPAPAGAPGVEDDGPSDAAIGPCA